MTVELEGADPSDSSRARSGGRFTPAETAGRRATEPRTPDGGGEACLRRVGRGCQPRRDRPTGGSGDRHAIPGIFRLATRSSRRSIGARLSNWRGSAARLLGSLSPGEALHEWMRLFVDYIATKKVMASALGAIVASTPELYASSTGQITNAMVLLVDRASAAGDIRPNVDPNDLLRALVGLHLWQRQSGLAGERAAPDRYPYRWTATVSSR